MRLDVCTQALSLCRLYHRALRFGLPPPDAHPDLESGAQQRSSNTPRPTVVNGQVEILEPATKACQQDLWPRAWPGCRRPPPCPRGPSHQADLRTSDMMDMSHFQILSGESGALLTAPTLPRLEICLLRRTGLTGQVGLGLRRRCSRRGRRGRRCRCCRLWRGLEVGTWKTQETRGCTEVAVSVQNDFRIQQHEPRNSERYREGQESLIEL